MTIAVLGLLIIRDGVSVIQNQPEPGLSTRKPSARKITARKFTARKFTVVVLILAAVAYMILIPSIDSILDRFRERPTSYVIEDLTAFEVLRIRSAKLVVFAIFAYAGACVGSFLNVVAASAPLGETITLRSSACPQCGTAIRRIDNLPLFSYLKLGGRCRACATSIPIRYFVVEWIGLSIFALLFLYELVTGGWNIPGFPHYHYAGILWIIMYTKWPVVGIYLFHCLMFSCLLTLALMELDHLKAPRWMTIAMPLFFGSVAIAFPFMLTVSLFDQTPFQLPRTIPDWAIPDWIDRAATCLAGGGLGLFVGRSAKSLKLRNRQSSCSLAFGFALVGISLGWQAVLTIAVVWLIVMLVSNRFGGRLIRKRWLTPTTVLFLIAMLHHPIWEVLAKNLSF